MNAMKRKREGKETTKVVHKPAAAWNGKEKARDERPAKKVRGEEEKKKTKETKEETKKTEKKQNGTVGTKKEAEEKSSADEAMSGPTTIQIVTGSYDRTLHGVTATISGDGVSFADTFLFNAHTSAIRCLALSPASAPVPGQGQRVMLATGSTDERINIYNLWAHPPRASRDGEQGEERRVLETVVRRPVMAIAQSRRNRELGTLLHHSSTVTRLSFPTRAKLLSASEDSTVAVTRTRDWSLLSTIRVPVAKAGAAGGVHRPSGDTSAPGAAPAGVNDFAVHPSLKVMISVSRGERCMRLWNLVTGRKAGVLNFGRDLLRDLGEGRHASGEGRQVAWKGLTDSEEDEFAVGFDRNVVVFGMNSRPRCKLLPDARTKTHDFCYLDGPEASLLAVATEDGRILLASTQPGDLAPSVNKSDAADPPLPCARLVGQLGGKALGITGRVKAFKALPVVERADDETLQRVWYVVAAASTGALRVWRLPSTELEAAVAKARKTTANEAPQLGQLLGTYQTPDRITCVEAFVMIPRPDGVESDEEDEEESNAENEDEDEE